MKQQDAKDKSSAKKHSSEVDAGDPRDSKHAKKEQTSIKARDANSERTSKSDANVDNQEKKKPPAAKKKMTRRKKSKVPSLEEMAASVEIDRLLQQAHEQLYRHEEWQCNERLPLDPQNTLEQAKKKLGCAQLLRLLKTKMCTRCEKKLGM